jgi:hypothetical protein
MLTSLAISPLTAFCVDNFHSTLHLLDLIVHTHLIQTNVEKRQRREETKLIDYVHAWNLRFSAFAVKSFRWKLIENSQQIRHN